MHIQWEVCHWAQCIYHKRSNCYIWNKPAIHYVNMNPITPCQLNGFDLYITKFDYNRQLAILWHGNKKCEERR